jgi:Uma2 family endonuclease
MSPLPKHGREAHLLARIVEILLDRGNRNYEAFTPITMDIPDKGGIEPDYCFYIDNWQAVVGKERLNWQTVPPPDLVIEIDVTTYTAAEDDSPYCVLEVRLLKRGKLQIYGLPHGSQAEAYQLQSYSRYFPKVDLPNLSSKVLQATSE